MSRIDEWVDKNWQQLLILAMLVMGSWVTLKAQVADKVDSTVFREHIVREEVLKAEILQQLVDIRLEQRQVHLYICQTQSKGLGCQ